MAGGVCVHPPTAGVDVEQRGAEYEDLLLGLVEVSDIEVQMKLLWMCGLRPSRRPVTCTR